MSPTLESKPETISTEDLEFIRAAAALGLKFIDEGAPTCKLKAIFTDILNFNEPVEDYLSVAQLVCCSACAKYRSEPIKYAECMQSCDPSC